VSDRFLTPYLLPHLYAARTARSLTAPSFHVFTSFIFLSMNPSQLTPSANENRSTAQELLSSFDPLTAYNLKALRMLSDSLSPRNILPHESVCPCGGVTYRDRETGVIGCRECGEMHRDE
jgi:hypothetical protein